MAGSKTVNSACRAGDFQPRPREVLISSCWRVRARVSLLLVSFAAPVSRIALVLLRFHFFVTRARARANIGRVIEGICTKSD